MNLSKNLPAIAICLAGALIVAVVLYLQQGVRPSDAVIKDIVEKQLKARVKNLDHVVSVSLIRGAEYPSQAHYSIVAYGTKLYPVAVKAVYITKQKNGAQSDPREWSRTLNLYRDSTHQWVNDVDLK